MCHCLRGPSSVCGYVAAGRPHCLEGQDMSSSTPHNPRQQPTDLEAGSVRVEKGRREDGALLLGMQLGMQRPEDDWAGAEGVRSHSVRGCRRLEGVTGR